MSNLYYKSDNLIQLHSLKDKDGNIVDYASVVAKIWDSSDNELASVTLVNEGNGKYKGVIPFDVGIDNGDHITIGVTATTSETTKYWEERYWVVPSRF